MNHIDFANLQKVEIQLPRVNALARLRRSFFALGAEASVRYRVTFEQVVMHLWQVRRRHGRIPLRGVLFIEDLVHAVGCATDNRLAWTDLKLHYDRVLIRQCLNRIEESDAIVFVRRFFSELEQVAREADPQDHPLLGFIGDRPLRAWLGDQISDALTGGMTIHQPRRSVITWSPERRTVDRYGQPATIDPGDPLPFPAPERSVPLHDLPTRPAVPSSE